MIFETWNRYFIIANLFFYGIFGHPQIRGMSHKRQHEGYFHRHAMHSHHVTSRIHHNENNLEHSHHGRHNKKGFTTYPSSISARTPSLNSHHMFQSRIIGGIPAVENEFPFFASLDVGCGGSLIAPNIVLTAAHCAGGINTVRIGSNKAKSGGIINTVMTECVHPDYQSSTTVNDFMLLKLKNSVDIDTFPPIQINNNKAIPRVNQMLTVIGFGATSEGGSGSNTLLKVAVPANSHQQCNQQYGGGIEEDVMFCAGFTAGGKDSCQGDSGGPIFENRGGQLVQVGVVSFGEGCARPNKSGVYSRVSGAYDWIQSTAEKLSKGDTSGCGDGMSGGQDDDSFPNQAPVQGPIGNVPTSGNDESPTLGREPIAPTGPISTSAPAGSPVATTPSVPTTMEAPIGASPSVPSAPVSIDAPINASPAGPASPIAPASPTTPTSPVSPASPVASSPTADDCTENGDDVNDDDDDSSEDDDERVWSWWS